MEGVENNGVKFQIFVRHQMSLLLVVSCPSWRQMSSCRRGGSLPLVNCCCPAAGPGPVAVVHHRTLRQRRGQWPCRRPESPRRRGRSPPWRHDAPRARPPGGPPLRGGATWLDVVVVVVVFVLRFHQTVSLRK